MAARALATGAAVAAIAATAAGRRFRHWGSTPAERARTYPGDDLVPEPATTITRATTVEAPAPEVWAWLVQMGQDRGGMYSYDWLENVVGLKIHSTADIREEWQHLAPGDRVVMVPKGWRPLPGGYSLPVAAIEPGRAIVLRQAPPEHPWNAVWTFVIEPEGAERCRLLSRSRAERRPGAAGRLNAIATDVMDPVTLVMTRKMLLGIKRRAEARWRARLPG